MNTLSKSRRWVQNKTEVKFLQAWCNQFEGANLSVDGDYWDKTYKAVYAYQVKHGLKKDGIAGPQTLQHMGFRQAKNKKIVILEIPFTCLSVANVLLKNGQGYTCEKFARSMGYDIVMNGAFFQMSNRKVVQLLMRKGKVDNWGMGTKGIAFHNQWEGGAFGTEVGNLTGKPYDLQGGAPYLIYNGKKDIQGINDFKNPAIMSSQTRRSCIGLTKSSIVLMFSIENCTLYDMLNEGLYQKLTDLIGVDGGGSQSFYMGGAWVITTDGRLIPAAVGFKMKR